MHFGLRRLLCFQHLTWQTRRRNALLLCSLMCLSKSLQTPRKLWQDGAGAFRESRGGRSSSRCIWVTSSTQGICSPFKRTWWVPFGSISTAVKSKQSLLLSERGWIRETLVKTLTGHFCATESDVFVLGDFTCRTELLLRNKRNKRYWLQKLAGGSRLGILS